MLTDLAAEMAVRSVPTFSLKLIAEALSDLVHVHNQSEFQLCWCCPASLCLLKVCTWFPAVIFTECLI